ncbi:BBE domain-containing protein [Vibrio ostreae]|uniref:BBE domain-containing protein n=1 Tax=Vibrio ostreae TaxID=2841925 RepID=UPI002113CBB6|nr:BBE domain-containing protein [Vibrio ostreae]
MAGPTLIFLTQDEAGRTESAYGPTFKRLQAIKKKYDPDNLFCMNQNIKPA